MDGIRFTGLASGMDTDNIVKQLMVSERAPLNKMEQQKQTLEWQRDAYRDINKSLLEMKDYLFNNFLLQSNFIKAKAASSNELSVAVKALGANGNFTGTVNNVQQLATAAQWTSLGAVNYTQPEADLTLKFDVKKPGDATFTTQTIEIKKTDKLEDVINKISRSNLNVSAFYDEFTGKMVLSSKDTGKGAEIKVNDDATANFMNSLGFTDAQAGKELGDTGGTTPTTWASNTTIDKTKTLSSFSITNDTTPSGKISFLITDKNGNDVPYSPTTLDPNTATLEDVVEFFNTSGSGINATIDSSGRVSLKMADGGPMASIKPGNDNTAKLFQQLGFANAKNGYDLGDTNTDGVIDTKDYSIRKNGVKQEGQNSIFTYNGITTERTSNTVRIDRVELTLKETTNSPVTITSNTDIDAMVDKVKEFIEKYNGLIDKVYSKTKEEKFRDFKPLTQEQKDAMEEKDIEKWEEKAKSGLLRNDSILTNSIYQIRSLLYQEVNKSGETNKNFNQLSEIGIVTTKNYLDGGKLMLNTEKSGPDQLTGEERLRKALEEDPYAVFSLFSSDGTSSSEKGIARRMRESVDQTMLRIEEKAGKDTSQLQQYTIGQSLDDLDDRMTSFEKRLKDIEERYYRQFTAMEKAIQKANEQGTYLANYLGGQK